MPDQISLNSQTCFIIYKTTEVKLQGKGEERGRKRVEEGEADVERGRVRESERQSER